MNVTATIDSSSLRAAVGELDKVFQAASDAGRAAMTEVFYADVMANFGSQGFDRPRPWQRLSKRYAKKVGRSFATLVVTGSLRDSIKRDIKAGTVSMDNSSVPYATAHHEGRPPNYGFTVEGSGELPARRVFPLDPATDEPTEKVVRLCSEAARQAVVKALEVLR